MYLAAVCRCLGEVQTLLSCESVNVILPQMTRRWVFWPVAHSGALSGHVLLGDWRSQNTSRSKEIVLLIFLHLLLIQDPSLVFIRTVLLELPYSVSSELGRDLECKMHVGKEGP